MGEKCEHKWVTRWTSHLRVCLECGHEPEHYVDCRLYGKIERCQHVDCLVPEVARLRSRVEAAEKEVKALREALEWVEAQADLEEVTGRGAKPYAVLAYVRAALALGQTKESDVDG